ncbi:hypothetical protein [Agrococcus beijingensis]|uniref:hypothetical protein n=1 Tax=Agrococcus beijingensis TaxID=3068634 RepID=UPI00274041C0|nr:hypothetical protein [Agrococcus sp. REN33]
MSTGSPEFVMPPPESTAASMRSEAQQARRPVEIVPPDPAVLEPDGFDPTEHGGRRRLRWTHLAAAAVLGLVAGIGVPGALVAAERAGADTAAQELRAAALAYVDAIAAGDSRAATEMVPIRGLAYAAPPEVLRAARTIEVPQVEVVHVEGDRGTAEVHYRVYGVDVYRTLQAERVDDAWQLRTSLAEVVDAREPGNSLRATVAGVRLGGFLPVMLYPGVYTFDAAAGPVLVVGGDVFAVDGDPRTPTAPEVTVTVVPAVAERATELAEAAIESCRERPGCLVPSGSRLRFVDRVTLTASDPVARTIDLIVGFTALDAPAQPFFQMQLRAVLDDRDEPLRWECGQPGVLGGPTSTCEP